MQLDTHQALALGADNTSGNVKEEVANKNLVAEGPGVPKVRKKRRKRDVGISDRAPEASRRPRALPTVTEALRERFLEARGSLRTPFWRPKREVPTLTKPQ